MNNSYSFLEKRDMLECYIESGKNAEAACALYFQRYPERSQPSGKLMCRIWSNLEIYGRFNKPRSKKYNKRNEADDSINILGYFTANPTKSSRNAEKELGISQTRIVSVLKKHKYKAYRTRKVNKLYPADAHRRLEFCRWYLRKIRQNPNFGRNVIWTDEARISSDGIYNRYNSYYWSDINPHQTVEPLRQGKFGFNVWVAIYNNRIIAYHIYDDNLNGALYRDILEENLEFLDDLPLIERQQIFFQQDGAPAHNAGLLRVFLNGTFPNQWLGTRGPIPWPARSPDLSVLDFFFWGYLKDIIYKGNRNTLRELRDNFENSIRKITNIHIQNAVNAVKKRCRLCIRQRGLQFEHLV